MIVLAKTTDWSQDLFRDMRPISGMSFDFSVAEPSYVLIFGHVDVQHRKFSAANTMVAFKLKHNGVWLEGSTTGENVDLARHYYAVQIHGYFEADAGQHNVTLYGRSASTADPRNGIVEIKPGYNQVIVKVEPR